VETLRTWRLPFFGCIVSRPGRVRKPVLAASSAQDTQFAPQPRPDLAHYIANWLKALKSDKRAVFTAAARAAEAAAFIQAKPSS
jgi:antirestriction protein ArdC